MNNKEIELSELKAIELNIMKKIHDFCKANDIWYCLAYGTLLGAIRHNGYIPWDDDIDIHMTREGYDIFRREFPSWGAKNSLEIIDSHTKENAFPRDIIKVCDSRTQLIETDYKNNCKLGAFVDIWPLDRVPAKLTFSDRIWIMRIVSLRNLSLASDISTSTNTFKNLSIFKRLFIRLLGHFNSSVLVIKQEKLSRKYNSIETNKLVAFQDKYCVFDEKDLLPSVLHQFEDTEFFIPCNYDSVLRQYFGDYMEMPPLEEQKPHHVQQVCWK